MTSVFSILGIGKGKELSEEEFRSIKYFSAVMSLSGILLLIISSMR